MFFSYAKLLNAIQWMAHFWINDICVSNQLNYFKIVLYAINECLNGMSLLAFLVGIPFIKFLSKRWIVKLIIYLLSSLLQIKRISYFVFYWTVFVKNQQNFGKFSQQRSILENQVSNEKKNGLKGSRPKAYWVIVRFFAPRLSLVLVHF